MRTLHKIVFINSASVQYAEMELNGNVHLTGTQGVGKSTLLRAILFFYNANKTRLGIAREKQSFDEYYFPYQNSYIIYEVSRSEIPYCVLAYKVNGKTAFRFIDSAYNRELFIDENNRAYQSWDRIRQALGRDIYYTNLITSYKEFRQIIYGDNRDLKSEFRKYAILESKQYQNIPLTIQNVFLNSKLEASFIKDTIIKSIDEEEFTIDLENYRTQHLRNFENQIKDIQLWFQTNKNGIVPIRQQAKNIIDTHRNYIYINEQKKELAEELARRMAFIETEKPLLKSNIQVQETKLNELLKEQERLENLHRKREDDLNADIKILKTKLKDAKSKEEYYQRQHVEKIIKEVIQKERWENNRDALIDEKTTLTDKFSDIRRKYENLINQVQNQLDKAENDNQAAVNKLKQEFSEQKTDIWEIYQNILSQINDDHEKHAEESRKRLNEFQTKESHLDKKKIELKYQNYFEEELIRNKNEEKEIEKSNREIILELNEAKIQVKNHRREGEMEIEKADFDANNTLEKVLKERKRIIGEKEELENKLNKISSSLYGWLGKNIPDWEVTIGKVISEEVLFHGDLNPQFVSGEKKNFYGLELNFNALKSKIKSIDQYKNELNYLRDQLEENQQTNNVLEQQKEDVLARIRKRFNKRINELNEIISKGEYRIEQNENKLKRNRLERDELNERNKEKKEKFLKEIENQLNKLISQRLGIEKEISRNQSNKNRNISLKIAERDKKISGLKENQINEIENLNKILETAKTGFQKRIDELKIQQNAEFKDKGADTKRIEEIEKQLIIVNEKLRYIKDNETLVIEYRKDKRELFDLVPEWKSDLKSKEKQQENILEIHQKEKEKTNKKYSEQRSIVERLSEKFKGFTNDEEKFQEFKITLFFLELEKYFTPEIMASELAKPAETSILELNFKSSESIRVFDNLKQKIHNFVGNFNENNIFKFPTIFTSARNYLDFVINLKEFVEENKIEEYQKRVNERFAHIIQLIGKETQELISKEAEIEKVIRKINVDFASRNFVEAIKEMEMRTQESSNPVVRLLLEIKGFNDENQLTIGGLNLFSNEGSDSQNKKAIHLLQHLIKELDRYKKNSLNLSESFDLQFRIVENDNDSGWVEKLSHVGSEGTDVLVKAMINILLLNVFKSDASRKFKDFKLHCMMDEIGRLHPNNIKGILRFANERNIYLINGSPISQSATDYKYTYHLSKQQSQSDKKKYITKVNSLIKMRPKVKQHES